MKTEAWKPPVIFGIFGALLLLVAFLLTDATRHREFWLSALQNVALVAVTVVVVEVLWTLVGREPVRAAIQELQGMLSTLRDSVQLLGDSHRTGLRRIYATSGAAGSYEDWMRRLESATRAIDLMGYTMHVCTKGAHFEDTMKHLATVGVQVRVLIMAEDNPELPAFINHRQIKGVSKDTVVTEIKAARSAFKAIAESVSKASAKGSFEIKILKAGLIVTQLVRTDSTITAIQYLYHAVASRTPLLEVYGEDTELFKRYGEEFESLWRLAEPA